MAHTNDGRQDNGGRTDPKKPTTDTSTTTTTTTTSTTTTTTTTVTVTSGDPVIRNKPGAGGA